MLRPRSCRATISNPSPARKRGSEAISPTGSISRAASVRKSRTRTRKSCAATPRQRWWYADSTRRGANTCPRSESMDRESFEIFLIRETRLLDERRFREWMELFTEDGIYWVPATPGQESPVNSASLFYDDRGLMKTRV